MKTRRFWYNFILFLLVISLGVSTLSACQKTDETKLTQGTREDGAETVGVTVAEESKPAPALVKGIPFKGVSGGKALTDYKAYWDNLEKNYPLLDMLKRKGVDTEAIKEEFSKNLPVRADAEGYEYFYFELTRALTGDDFAAHLSPIFRGDYLLDWEYQTYVYELETKPDEALDDYEEHVFNDPRVIGFYGLEVKPREKDEEPPRVSMRNKLKKDFRPEMDFAYLGINSFLVDDEEEDREVREFFLEAEKQNLGHVIIDLRGNMGGYIDYWVRNIVAPNISQTLETENIGLYKDSPHIHDYLEKNLPVTLNLETLEEAEEGEFPALAYSLTIRDEKLPELPALNEEDTAHLSKSVLGQLRVSPTEEQALFSGKFWILTDGDSYSSADEFAQFAKRTGFATVVGTATGGDGAAVIQRFFVLPESGLIINYNALYGLNEDGSGNEDVGTAPDVEVANGRDALKKAVELIGAEKKNE